MKLSTPLKQLTSIPSSSHTKLKRLGIETIGDLLRHIPSRYEDYSSTAKITELTAGEPANIQGTITGISTRKSWKRKIMVTEASIEDPTGIATLVWFGLRNLDKQIRPGSVLRVSGKVSGTPGAFAFQSPQFEHASRKATHTGRLVPTYPETYGISSKWLRWQIGMILQLPLEFDDPIPEETLARLHLPNLKTAFIYLHFPKTKDHSLLAEKRFAFEEMFLVQLKSLQLRGNYAQKQTVPLILPKNRTDNFTDLLPFSLTKDQQKAIVAIFSDLEKTHPMNRLLNGDVGSGKTAVALAACHKSTLAGYQSVILAPTEVLAYQHFLGATSLLKKTGITFALVTHSYQLASQNGKIEICKKNKLLADLKNGWIDITVGTHALIQKTIRFNKLALVIVDEQHRFGVEQRAYLQQRAAEINDGIKNTTPHFLTMTATPIPRTLTLAFFGDLDISLLEEMPKGRKEIETRIVSGSQRTKMYAFIESEINKGRQVYVILPLVEESEQLTHLKDAESEYERLKKDIFPNARIGLVHGKLKSAEKESVMRDFKNHALDILVSTSVIEVGIDIPNATVMVIEDAERFGLSQLHQFRGRVGRGEHKSYCFLLTSGSNSNKRLKSLEQTASGFEIAKKDLEIRGPGEFLGTRQAGMPDISMENMNNMRLIEIARQEAQDIITNDPTLKNHPLLAMELKQFFEKVHLE